MRPLNDSVKVRFAYLLLSQGGVVVEGMGEVDGVRKSDFVTLFGEDEIVEIGEDTLETEVTLESVWLPR